MAEPTAGTLTRPCTVAPTRVAGVVAALLGTFCLWISLQTAARDLALRGDQPVTRATVWHREYGKNSVIHLDVRFVTAEGHPVTGRVYEFRDPPPRVGDVVEVRYDRRHPGRYVRDATKGPSYLEPILYLPLGLVLVAAGFAMVVRRRTRVS